MGFGGGGGGGEITQYNPQPNDPHPELTGRLVNSSIDSLRVFRPFGVHGAGYQMANLSPMGQIHTPGPNQSQYGNPYTTTGHQPYFGASPQYPTQIGMGGGSGGGAGSGGASNNTGSGDKLSGYVPPATGALPAGRAYTQGGDLLGMLNAALATQIINPNPGGNPGSGAGPGGGAGYPGLPPWANPPQPDPQVGATTPPPAAASPPASPSVFEAPTPPAYDPAVGGLGMADPWAGTTNAQGVAGGTNWNPDGTYNAQGAYSPIATWVDANGQPVANNPQAVQAYTAQDPWVYTPGGPMPEPPQNNPYAPPGGYAGQTQQQPQQGGAK